MNVLLILLCLVSVWFWYKGRTEAQVVLSLLGWGSCGCALLIACFTFGSVRGLFIWLAMMGLAGMLVLTVKGWLNKSESGVS